MASPGLPWELPLFIGFASRGSGKVALFSIMVMIPHCATKFLRHCALHYRELQNTKKNDAKCLGVLGCFFVLFMS